MDDNEGLDLVPYSPPNPTDDSGSIPYNTEKPPFIPSTNLVASRAKGMSYAMGPLSPGLEEVQNGLSQGLEYQLRQTYANQRGARDFTNNREIAKLASRYNMGEVSPEEEQAFETLLQAPVYDPDTIIEQAHADRLMTDLTMAGVRGDNNPVAQTLIEATKYQNDHKSVVFRRAADNVNYVAKIVSFQQFAKKTYEDATDELNQTSGNFWSGLVKSIAAADDPAGNWTLSPEEIKAAPYALDLLKNVTNSLYGWYKYKTILKDIPGDLDEKVDGLLSSKNMEEFKTKFLDAYNQIKADSPYLAASFAAAVSHRTTMDQFLDKAGIIADIGTIAAGGLKVAVKSSTALGGWLRGAAKYSINVPISTEKTLAEMGNTTDAAVMRVVREATNRSDPALGATNELQRVADGLHTINNPGIVTSNMGGQSVEVGNRLTQMLQVGSDKFRDIMGRVITPETLTPQAVEEGAKRVLKEMQDYYPKLNDSVYNMTAAPSKTLRGGYDVELQIGYTGAEQFPTKIAAHNTARSYGFKKGQYEIKENPNGKAYISVTKPLPENGSLYDFMIKSDGGSWTEKPKNAVSNFLYKWGILNPDNVLNPFNMENRALATYASSEFRKIFEENAKEIGKLSNKGKYSELDALNDIMRWNNEMDHPTIRGERGYTYQNPAELQQGYMSHPKIQRMPSEQETRAYFAAAQLQEMDLVLRRLAVLGAKQRQGVENFTLKFPSKSPLVTANSEKTGRTTPFEGVRVKTFPESPEPATIAVVGKDGVKLMEKNNLDVETKKDLMSKVNNGSHQMIQVHSPYSSPLVDSGILDEHHVVHYVITDLAQSEPIGYLGLRQKGGWHQVYDYSHFLKMARLSPDYIDGSFINRYTGDITLMPVRNAKEGKDIADKINTAIEMMHVVGMPGVEEYIAKNIPGLSPSTFMSWFEEVMRDGKKVPAFLSKDQKVVVVPNGMKVKDVDKTLGEAVKGGKYRDGTSDPYDLSKEINIGFTGERSDPVYGLSAKGSEANPLWAYEAADTVDGVTMLGRALGKAISTRFMEPYQTSSVNAWIREFGHLLNTKPEILANNPSFFFHNPDYLKGAGLVNPEALQAAETSRYFIRQFLGYKSDTRKELDKTHALITNSLARYGEYKGGSGYKHSDVYQNGVLPFIDNAPDLLRHLNFKANMGFFNWTQFAPQAATATHAIEVAGARPGFAGVIGASLSAYGKFTRNPQVLEQLDAMAVKASKWLGKEYSYKPGEWKAAHEAMFNTGYGNVGGEVASWDHITDPTLYRSTIGKILDAGDAFFKGGEMTSRFTGWHTAYTEWKQANPFAQPTEKELREILGRARIMNYNMDRASNSALNSGVLSLPFQFQTYAKNMAEQMFMGDRYLSKYEKLRTFLVQSALWGIPTGLSGATAIPMYDAIKSYYMDRGIDVKDTYLQPLMEGWVNFAVDHFAGIDADFRQRFGGNGMTFIQNAWKFLWEQDPKAMADMFTGVSGANIGRSILAANPYWRYVNSIFDNGDQRYPPPNLQDFIDVTRYLTSTGNIAYRWYHAANTGRWINRNDLSTVDNIKPSEAAVLGLTGTNPTKATEAFEKAESIKDVKNSWNNDIKFIVENIQRGVDALTGPTPNFEANEYYRIRAKVAFERSGMPPNKWNEIWQKAMSSGYQNKADQIDKTYWTYGITPEQRQQRLDATTRLQKLRANP